MFDIYSIPGARMNHFALPRTHSSTELKPGSWYIMLIGPKQVPVMGEVVHLTLVLSDGSEQRVVDRLAKTTTWVYE
jgi:copper(I)-binding protein